MGVFLPHPTSWIGLINPIQLDSYNDSEKTWHNSQTIEIDLPWKIIAPVLWTVPCLYYSFVFLFDNFCPHRVRASFCYVVMYYTFFVAFITQMIPNNTFPEVLVISQLCGCVTLRKPTSLYNKWALVTKFGH